jgi:hypothetical protein
LSALFSEPICDSGLNGFGVLPFGALARINTGLFDWLRRVAIPGPPACFSQNLHQ